MRDATLPSLVFLPMIETSSQVYIGCAGWSVPSPHAHHFAETGTHLERYASRFNAVEINSSFYRPHRPQTYEKWAESVPEVFRFAVKMPKVITHELRLKAAAEPLERFLSEASHLGPKLGPVLVQLPPSRAFQKAVASEFFDTLRQQFQGQVVCEPRHASWFAPVADDLLTSFQISRVAADPVLVSGGNVPGGWDGLSYYRLHGSPRVYYSAYAPDFLDELAITIRTASADATPVWCIFDNTAEGAATQDALHLQQLLA